MCVGVYVGTGEGRAPREEGPCLCQHSLQGGGSGGERCGTGLGVLPEPSGQAHIHLHPPHQHRSHHFVPCTGPTML